MLNLAEQEATFLQKSIEIGEVVLILGAGASSSSKNSQKESIVQAEGLARIVADRAGLPYNGEKLPMVLDAVRGALLSDQQLYAIYAREFTKTDPSTELTDLFNYSWKRLYTWCIDDALDNLQGRRIQRFRFINGMRDHVVKEENPAYLQIIKLHGDASAPEFGLVMTDAEYSQVLVQGKHHWYAQAANDYVNHTPIFIGSRLAEPILAAELERAKRDVGSTALGKAFLITPDKLTAIEKASFSARGITHIEATLADFVHWLEKCFPRGLSPQDILRKSNKYTNSDQISHLTPEDVGIAHSLFPIDVGDLSARALTRDRADHDRDARNFLRGSPPTFALAASDIPVWLKPTDSLYSEMSQSISERARLFVAVGQSGSGKTTSLLQSLLRYGREHPDIPIYELQGNVRSVRAALSLLRRLHDGQVIVYVVDLFLFGDAFSEDIMSVDSGFTVVSTARTGEWRDRLMRRVGGIARAHEFSRFTSADYSPLVDKLLQYVPAPALAKLDRNGQLEKLKKSREQLLIALREATSSETFNETIKNEFEKLPDRDTKIFVIVCAIATLARVGVSVGTAKEVFMKVSAGRTFEQVQDAASSIVSRLSDGRLHARHELYVRHIIENVVEINDILDCQTALLESFTKFAIPVVKHVNRIDASLFRFCLNHDVVYQQCIRRHDKFAGRRLYSHFEIYFQLDGHFWLQYGLYIARCGESREAMDLLVKSIQAYPGNPFAVHALAELKLQTAYERPIYDDETADLVNSAVQSLLELDAGGIIENDQYPMVTLLNLHVGSLIRHNRHSEAQKYARLYYERLRLLEKQGASGLVTTAKEKALKYATTGEWENGKQKSRVTEVSRRAASHWRKGKRPGN